MTSGTEVVIIVNTAHVMTKHPHTPVASVKMRTNVAKNETAKIGTEALS